MHNWFYAIIVVAFNSVYKSPTIVAFLKNQIYIILYVYIFIVGIVLNNMSSCAVMSRLELLQILDI